MFFLPTYEEALNLTKTCEAFYVTYTEVRGFQVAMFDYRLATYNDFKVTNGFELRGLTFVNNNGVWERHLGLHKFFNVNQVEDWQESILAQYDLETVRVKEDGSMIMTPIFPNDEIVAKTKMAFESTQALAAQKIIDESENYQTLIRHLNTLNVEPIFEYVSPHNQIVLQYENTKLVLLQARYKDTGKYVDIYTLNAWASMFKIPLAQHVHVTKSFKDLLDMRETLTGIEGFVIAFTNGVMAKIKTTWYMERHGILSEDNVKENVLIRTILGLPNEDGSKNAEIDDILGALGEGSEKKDFIISTMDKINHYFNHTSKILRDYILAKKELNLDKKTLYFNIQDDIKNGVFNADFAPMALNLMKFSVEELEEKIEDNVKDFIGKKTFKLTNAKDFLKAI